MTPTALTRLSSIMFIGELDRLSFTASGAVVFSIVMGGETVFSNTYHPDAVGVVTVYDVAGLIEPSLGELYADFTFLASGTPLGPETIRVFRCSWRVDVPASMFLDRYFLTPMRGVRNTVAGRHETLSLYSAIEEEAVAECRYYSDSGGVTEATVPLGTASGARILNVSPARMADPAKGRLFAYDVVCGSRRASYLVLAHQPEASDAFIFRNCFNAWETLYLTGTKEKDPQYARTSVNINGFLRNYIIEETISVRTYTGPLPPGMEEVAMNLADSKAVFFLLPNGDSGEEVAVTACDLKHDNSDKVTDLNFSYRGARLDYRLADDRTARISVPRPPRIFDESFDLTYE